MTAAPRSTKACCTGCDAPIDAGDAFCRACGTRLSRPRAASAAATATVGDRRQLTVMFCDLVGSTEMVSRLDPEDVQAVLRAYQQLAAEIIRNVDGHVAQYLGDGMLIYLGYPAAHEDDPARAVSAAMEIAREVPRLGERLHASVPHLRAGDLAVRIGIHTGPVVVGSVGSDLRRETLATGSTVNLAARLAAAADAGTVMVSDATAGRTRGAFVLEALEPQALKGLATPVMAFRPTAPRGIRSRIAAWSDGSGRAIVGRDAILADLARDWSAICDGQRRVTILRGEPGIGKTRLLQALRQHLGAAPHGWISCHGAALQQASALYPVVEAMRASLGLDGDEPAGVARDRLTAALAELGLETPAFVDRLARLLGFDGLALGPDDRAPALDSLAHWCVQLARGKPLVIAVEDLHWYDPSSLELLQLIIAAAADVPLYVIGTMRPETKLPWPPAHYRTIDVPGLGAADIAAIVSEIVGGTDPGAVAALVDRCDGVPLYAEELAQAFVEHVKQGAPGAGIPATLQDSIMARLDRLGPAKRLAQVGALLGRSFGHDMIAAVTGLGEAFLGPALAEIVSRGILHRDGIPPRATYTFRHALLQDAAADSMLRQQYRQDHQHIGATLAGQFPVLATENPMRIAHHFAEAGAGPEALDWYRRAGSRAQARAEYREAETAFRRAIAIAEAAEHGDAVHGLYGELGRILQLTRGYAAAETVEATVRARQPDDAGNVAFLAEERRLWQATLTRGDHDAAGTRADEVMAMWEADRSDGDLLMFALGARIQVDFFTGALTAMEASYARLAGLVDGIGRRQPPGNTVSSIGVAAMAAWWRGDTPTARARLGAAFDFAAANGNPYDLAMALHYQSQLLLCERDAAAAERVGVRLLALAEEQGFAYLAALVQGPIAWGRAHRGVGSGHAAQVRASLQGQIDAGARIAVPTQLNRLAEIELAEGDTETALATVEQALAFNPQERLYRPASLLLRGRLRAGAAAASDFAEALALAGTMGARAIELPAACALAAWHLDRREPAAAHAVLAPVAERCPTGCNPVDHAEAVRLLAAAAGGDGVAPTASRS